MLVLPRAPAIIAWGQVGPGNFGAMGTGAEVPHFSYENDTIATAFVRHWASGTNVR